MDHIYSLYSIINNRKRRRKSTFVHCIDARKAFDTVQRYCLWYTMMSIGFHGKILKAVQSLYSDVSCAVRVTDDITDWFNVGEWVKQGCVLSHTLFSVYVNDLANTINDLQCGVAIDNDLVAILLYADDIVLLSDNETAIQRMLGVVGS